MLDSESDLDMNPSLEMSHPLSPATETETPSPFEVQSAGLTKLGAKNVLNAVNYSSKE